MTREDAVRQLLLTQYDYLPIHGRTEFASAPGAAPSKKRCVECGGNGKRLVFDRAKGTKRFRLCLACGGQRWVPARKHEEAEDPYLVEKEDKNQQTVLVVQEERQTMTTWELNHELERIADAQIERSGGVGRYRDPRDAHDRAGSYRELRLALELLRQREPTLSEALGAFLRASEGPGHVSTWVKSLEAQAVSWIAERMPKEIRVPGETVESEQRKTIRELFESGWRLRRIAKELQVDLRTVKRAVAA